MISKSHKSHNTQFSKVSKLGKKYLILLLAAIFLGGTNITSIYAAKSITIKVTDKNNFLVTDATVSIDNISNTINYLGIYTLISSLPNSGQQTITYNSPKCGEKTEKVNIPADGNLRHEFIFSDCDFSSIDLDEVEIIGKIDSIKIDNSINITTKAITVHGEAISKIRINSPKLNTFFSNLPKAIEREKNTQRKKSLQGMQDLINTKKESGELVIKNDIYYFLTDSKGELNLKNLFIPADNYTFYYSDGNNVYKKNKVSQKLEKNKTILDLGIVKMYSNCNTGGQFDADCLFPAWASEDSNHESKEEVQGVYGKNNDGKIAMAIIPNIIDIILKFISPIVVIMFIFAGVKFIYAGSDEEDLNSAKDFFLYGGIRLAFIIMSYTLMKVIYFLLK